MHYAPSRKLRWLACDSRLLQIVRSHDDMKLDIGLDLRNQGFANAGIFDGSGKSTMSIAVRF